MQKPTPAAPARNNAALLLRWIDARGNLFPGGRIERMGWIWSRINEADPIESPALRLWVVSRLPSDWAPRKVTGDGVTVAEPFREGSEQRFALDLRTNKATLRFEFLDRKNRVHEMTLAIQVTVTRPYILVRPECNKHDLRFMVHKAMARHLFVGLSCVDLADSFDIYFFRSRDSTWNSTAGLIQFDPQNRFTAFKYHVAKPKAQMVYSQRLFRVGTLDDQSRASEYSVFYHPKLAPKSFYMNAGLGTSVYNYQEKVGSISLSQVSLTGKVSAGYRIIPRVLDVAFNMFGNLLTLSHSPSTLAAARFYGINGRLGYRLPMDLGATEFMFLTGIYVWGMSVSAAKATEQYGIKALAGPQLFITMLNSQAGHAGYWTYVKLALISDGFNLTTTGNRELAIGGGIELSARETKPFAITLDIAQAQFEAANKLNGMKLLSVTAGVQKGF